MDVRKKGATVVWKENGKDGLDTFQNSEIGTFDAVLMDVRMPVMDGIESTKAIRGLDRDDAKTIPIIAMTANAFDEDMKETIAAGMNVHLSKPVNPEKLYEVLTEQIIKYDENKKNINPKD